MNLIRSLQNRNILKRAPEIAGCSFTVCKLPAVLGDNDLDIFKKYEYSSFTNIEFPMKIQKRT